MNEVIGEFQIHIADDHTDIVGLRTLVLYQNWVASKWPLTIAQLDLERPAVPEVPGGLWLTDRQTRRAGGVLRTFWAFEGINGGGDKKDVTFKRRGLSPDFGFTPGFAELPLQQNKRIETLLDKYEGEVLDDRIIWPRTYGPDDKPNPMFGRQTFFGMQGGTYFYRYMARTVAEIPDIDGKVFETNQLPGEPPLKKDRNWMCAGVPYVKRGPVALEVQEVYWLSDEGGWPKPIYPRGVVAA